MPKQAWHPRAENINKIKNSRGAGGKAMIAVTSEWQVTAHRPNGAGPETNRTTSK